MKLAGFAVLLMAAMAFVVAGCSDNSAVPVSPTDQSVGVPRPLAKSTETSFEGIMWQNLGDPGFMVDPGIIKNPDGKTLFKGVQEKVIYAAVFPAGTTDLFSGNAVITLDGWADYNTGVGDFYGKLTLTPVNGGGGVWELTWHGKGTFGPLPSPVPGPGEIASLFGPYGWTLACKGQGPGKGGDLTGMCISMETNIYCTPDFLLWTGAYTGHVKSH